MISSDYIKLFIYCNNELDKRQFGGKVIHVFLNIYNYIILHGSKTGFFKQVGRFFAPWTPSKDM